MHSIGEASKRSGVHIETIRYYEREGILPPAERTASGRRVYGEDGLARLRFIKKSRDLGFSMTDAKAFLALATADTKSCGEVKPIAQMHLGNVEMKLRELSRLRDLLAGLVDQCGDPDGPCPILHELLEEV